jgi:hypothetical protein
MSVFHPPLAVRPNSVSALYIYIYIYIYICVQLVAERSLHDVGVAPERCVVVVVVGTRSALLEEIRFAALRAA